MSLNAQYSILMRERRGHNKVTIFEIQQLQSRGLLETNYFERRLSLGENLRTGGISVVNAKICIILIKMH